MKTMTFAWIQLMLHIDSLRPVTSIFEGFRTPQSGPHLDLDALSKQNKTKQTNKKAFFNLFFFFFLWQKVDPVCLIWGHIAPLHPLLEWIHWEVGHEIRGGSWYLKPMYFDLTFIGQVRLHKMQLICTWGFCKWVKIFQIAIITNLYFG